MRTQLLLFKFDSKSKPGVIIATGIRFETYEITGKMDDVKFPLLCEPNAKEVSKKDIEDLIFALKSNF